MNKLSAVVMALSIFAGAVLFTALSLDALEWELTGECRDCMILDKLRPSLADGGKTHV